MERNAGSSSKSRTHLYWSPELDELASEVRRHLRRIARPLRFSLRTKKQTVVLCYSFTDEELFDGLIDGKHVDILQYAIPVFGQRRCKQIPGTDYYVTHRAELCKQESPDGHPEVLGVHRFSESLPALQRVAAKLADM